MDRGLGGVLLLNNKRIIQIKEIISQKKVKFTIYIIGVLWIGVVMQIAINSLFQPNHNILEAFVSTGSQVSSFELEMAADYGTSFLSEGDKKELIMHVADKIGLQVKDELTINRAYDDCEVYFHKSGKNADTLIKVISIKEEKDDGVASINHYLVVRLKVYQNPDSILSYRKLLEDVFKELKVTDIQTTMQISSNYKGQLSLSDMNNIADSMIKNLDGKIAYANRVEDLFTVYAYTGLLSEYVTSLGNKINIHVAITYDEESNITKVNLGTPVISGSY